MKNILLICGPGASNGFMAVVIREAARKRQTEVIARMTSESQPDERVNEVDYLLIGSRLACMLNDIQEQMVEKKVGATIIPQAVYGTLDGEKVLGLIMIMEE